MKAGEIWILKYSDQDGVLLDEAVQYMGKPSWKCMFLRQIRPDEYVIAKGRVSTRIDPGAYYTGEGIITEDSLNKFHELRLNVRVVEAPDHLDFVTLSATHTSEPLGI